jgi:hypothetical protein
VTFVAVEFVPGRNENARTDDVRLLSPPGGSRGQDKSEDGFMGSKEARRFTARGCKIRSYHAQQNLCMRRCTPYRTLPDLQQVCKTTAKAPALWIHVKMELTATPNQREVRVCQRGCSALTLISEAEASTRQCLSDKVRTQYSMFNTQHQMQP